MGNETDKIKNEPVLTDSFKENKIYILYNIFSPLKSVRPVLNSPNEMAKNGEIIGCKIL